MKLISIFKKEKQIIYISLILALWALVIFVKYGGQSLLIHYLWPFIIAGSVILLFNKKWLKNKVSWIHILAILGLGAFLLTFVFDLSPSNGSLELINVGFGILLAITLSNIKWEEKTFKWLFAGIILVVCLLDIWGIISYASGHPFNRLVGPLIKPNEAFSGFPNLAANLNLLALLPAFYFFTNAKYKSKLLSLSVIVANVIIVTSLILTYSRAAWFAAIAVFGISIVVLGVKFWKNRKIIIKYVLSTALILLLSIALFIGINNLRSYNESTIAVGEKIAFQSEDEGSSVSERIASVERSVKMAIDHPLTGVGAGSFNYVSQSFEQKFYTLSSYPYSLPFKLLAEHGFIAFSLILIWIVGLLILALNKPSEYKLIAVLTAILLFIHHCMDNNFDFFAASFPLFLLLGMAWPELKTKSLIKNFWVVSMIVILTISGILFVGHEAYYGMYYIKGRNAAGSENHEQGVINYEKSFNLIFNRDARLAAANSSYELYKTFDQEKYLEQAKKYATDYLIYDNPLDKRAALYMAKFYSEQNVYSRCGIFVELARKHGGQNDFETDYFELLCTNDLIKKQELIENLIPKLENYYELLKVNTHMTVLTDNPKFAVKILNLISDEFPQYLPFFYDMQKLAILETEKFHNKYGIEAEIEFE
ncbi:O-antigen ligase family protein [Patescibacteria group bacterium]